MSTMKVDNIVSSGGTNTAQINGITPALSSQAQAEAGTDNTTQMTPLRVRNALNATGSAPTFACRAWVNFDGTVAASSMIRASGNVSSITDNGTGDYTINFATALPDENYTVHVEAGDAGAFANIYTWIKAPSQLQSASAVRIELRNNSAGLQDRPNISVSIFR
jgi:hypothetical protein